MSDELVKVYGALNEKIIENLQLRKRIAAYEGEPGEEMINSLQLSALNFLQEYQGKPITNSIVAEITIGREWLLSILKAFQKAVRDTLSEEE